ncbi:unnamed protein product [Didymodactylos carnosus]|nr:unnamed protein product [Didymodactylos carnosus]CAF4246916.1 unnamed protein product [Didymodactylos carnosus]
MRLFNSSSSTDMLEFFKFVSYHLIKTYSALWKGYDMIGLSLAPKTLEFNLLGFAFCTKQHQHHKFNSITSPLHNRAAPIRCSSIRYVINNFFNEKYNPSHVIVFESTTSPIDFNASLLPMSSNNNTNNKQTRKEIIKMQNLIKKLFQLERQIFFLSYYYNINFNQIICGLNLFHLYHNSDIDSSDLLERIFESAIKDCLPLLYRLYGIHQLFITW